MEQKKMKYESLQIEIIDLPSVMPSSDNTSVLTPEMLEGKVLEVEEKDGRLTYQLVNQVFPESIHYIPLCTLGKE